MPWIGRRIRPDHASRLVHTMLGGATACINTAPACRPGLMLALLPHASAAAGERAPGAQRPAAAAAAQAVCLLLHRGHLLQRPAAPPGGGLLCAHPAVQQVGRGGTAGPLAVELVGLGSRADTVFCPTALPRGQACCWVKGGRWARLEPTRRPILTARLLASLQRGGHPGAAAPCPRQHAHRRDDDR